MIFKIALLAVALILALWGLSWLIDKASPKSSPADDGGMLSGLRQRFPALNQLLRPVLDMPTYILKFPFVQRDSVSQAVLGTLWIGGACTLFAMLGQASLPIAIWLTWVIVNAISQVNAEFSDGSWHENTGILGLAVVVLASIAGTLLPLDNWFDVIAVFAALGWGLWLFELFRPRREERTKAHQEIDDEDQR